MTKEDQKARMKASLNRTSATSDAEPVATPVVRTKPVRLTVDISPDLHERTRRWAFESNVALVDAIRLFLSNLVDDPELAEQYQKALTKP